MSGPAGVAVCRRLGVRAATIQQGVRWLRAGPRLTIEVTLPGQRTVTKSAVHPFPPSNRPAAESPPAGARPFPPRHGTRVAWSTLSGGRGQPSCPGIARRLGSPAGSARELSRSLVPVDQPETAQVDPDAGFEQVFRRKGRFGPGRAARKELDDTMAQRPDMCREHLRWRALVGRDVL